MILYDSLYEILNTYIYGNPELLTTYQELVLTQLSTLGAVAICTLPFAAVYICFKFICSLTKGW